MASLLHRQPSSTTKTGRFIRAKDWTGTRFTASLFTEPTGSYNVFWALYLFLNPNIGYI